MLVPLGDNRPSKDLVSLVPEFESVSSDLLFPGSNSIWSSPSHKVGLTPVAPSVGEHSESTLELISLAGMFEEVSLKSLSLNRTRRSGLLLDVAPLDTIGRLIGDGEDVSWFLSELPFKVLSVDTVLSVEDSATLLSRVSLELVDSILEPDATPLSSTVIN